MTPSNAAGFCQQVTLISPSLSVDLCLRTQVTFLFAPDIQHLICWRIAAFYLLSRVCRRICYSLCFCAEKWRVNPPWWTELRKWASSGSVTHRSIRQCFGTEPQVKCTSKLSGMRKVFSDVRTNSPGSTMPWFAGPAKKSMVMFKQQQQQLKANIRLRE